VRVAWRAPAPIACPTCGDHAAGAEVEPTRSIRHRLVRSAQVGVSALRLAAANVFCHPASAELLREALRLSFPRVEAAGEGSALHTFSDAELRRLRGFARVDVALYGPDASSHDAHTGSGGSHARALIGVARWGALAGTSTGAYAVLHDPSSVCGFAEAWANKELPGAPRFRLSPLSHGAFPLDALADVAAGSVEPVRRALAAVLPPCVDPTDVPRSRGARPAFGDPGDALAPSGSDPLGTFDPCAAAPRCAAAHRCPGIPTGWPSQRISPI
jgi:hypothetical protein